MFCRSTKSAAGYVFCLFLVVAYLSCSNAGNVANKIPPIQLKDSRITKGEDVIIDQFPYIVQVLNTYEKSFLCGGTVVSARHIVSAAHCFSSYNAGDLEVIANATFLKDDPGAIRRGVETIYRHPKYNETTSNYDVVVLKLSEPLPLGRGVKKARLCKDTWQDNEKIIVLGWGDTAENATTHSNHLQIVKLDTLSNESCNDAVKGITRNMACSIVSEGKDACQGDSGGPAFYYNELCGVVSFGYGCGRNNSPSVFTSIPRVLAFITNSMRK